MEGGTVGGVLQDPSSSQVNIDTAWADTAPQALISHFQWSDASTYIHMHMHMHARISSEKDHTH